MHSGPRRPPLPSRHCTPTSTSVGPWPAQQPCSTCTATPSSTASPRSGDYCRTTSTTPTIVSRCNSPAVRVSWHSDVDKRIEEQSPLLGRSLVEEFKCDASLYQAVDQRVAHGGGRRDVTTLR